MSVLLLLLLLLLLLFFVVFVGVFDALFMFCCCCFSLVFFVAVNLFLDYSGTILSNIMLYMHSYFNSPRQCFSIKTGAKISVK